MRIPRHSSLIPQSRTLGALQQPADVECVFGFYAYEPAPPVPLPPHGASSHTPPTLVRERRSRVAQQRSGLHKKPVLQQLLMVLMVGLQTLRPQQQVSAHRMHTLPAASQIYPHIQVFCSASQVPAKNEPAVVSTHAQQRQKSSTETCA